MNPNKRKILGVDNSVANQLNVKKPKIIEEIQNEVDDSFLMEMLDFDFDFETQVPALDLTKWQRCHIESIEIINRNEKQLNLLNKLSNVRGVCIVQGNWIALNLKPGDVISILAAWDEQRNKFLCTAENGLIIYNPDFLISGTSVVGSLFCLRRGVLADRFKGFSSGNKIMTIGSLVHELFQTAIRKNLLHLKEVNAEFEELLVSQDTTYQLFATELSVAEIREEISKYIPNIINFMTKYIKNKRSLSDVSNPGSKLDEILDIEENIWLPNLGLKGKIDVTVKTVSGAIMPIELKTGRPSFSLEHKGQVGLYQMMLTALGKNVPTGLLLYLKDDILKEIKLRHNEKRDLIMLRNELAYYLNQNIEFMQPILKFNVPTLPDPINHHSACGKCPYNIICATYLRRDTNVQLSDSHPLKVLSDVALTHLTQNDIDYFVHWSGLISLENETIRRETPLKNVWLKSIEKRQADGTAIANLTLAGKVTEVDCTYLHIFSNQPDLTDKENVAKKYDLTKSLVNVGDYVLVSVPNRVAVATGHVKAISKHHLTVLLERNLTQNYKNLSFIIDKYVSEASLAINFTNLGALLDDTEAANRLRRIIVEKEKSKFNKTIPREIATKAEGILRALNHIQRKAVLKSIATQDYILIKGLPGTGKTQTLVALIQILVILGKSVLITSHTNSAVDNVLLRLKTQNLSFLRLGSINKIHQDLQEYSEHHILEGCKSPEELQKRYNQYQVFGVTCYGASHILLSQREFDVCIVDESTQVFQMTVFRPLLSARKFVLVGDPDQLPPIIRSSQAKNLGADESLFSRLDSDEVTVTLTLQYRMNKCITNLANKLTYKGGLVCANNELAKSTFVVPNTEVIMNNYASEKWLLKSLSTHIDQSVILLDTENVFEKSLEFQEQQSSDVSIIGDANVSFVENHKNRGTIYANYCEAAVIVYLINSLVKAGVSFSSIGIIAPYRAQVDLLKLSVTRYNESLCADGLSQSNNEIEVNTVDQYQGRDKQIIIYSCTKSNNTNYKPQPEQVQHKHDGEILEDHRRLTVAITRAKHKLILIGDLATLQNYTPFRSLFNCIGNVSKTKLVDGKMGFSWQAILNHFDNILNNETNLESTSQSHI